MLTIGDIHVDISVFCFNFIFLNMSDHYYLHWHSCWNILLEKLFCKTSWNTCVLETSVWESMTSNYNPSWSNTLVASKTTYNEDIFSSHPQFWCKNLPTLPPLQPARISFARALASVGNRGSSSRTGYETKARTWDKHNRACKNRAQHKLSKMRGSHSGDWSLLPSRMWHSVVWSIINNVLMELFASIFTLLA
jgi:hypothetical protein